MFKGKKGQKLAADIGNRNTKTFVPGAALPNNKTALDTQLEAERKMDTAAIKVYTQVVEL